jgi:hypothetical protein
MRKFLAGKEFDEDMEVISRLTREGLSEFAFIVERHVHFMRNVWPPMEKRLASETVPRRFYSFEMNIWNPKNYIKYQ